LKIEAVCHMSTCDYDCRYWI